MKRGGLLKCRYVHCTWGYVDMRRHGSAYTEFTYNTYLTYWYAHTYIVIDFFCFACLIPLPIYIDALNLITTHDIECMAASHVSPRRQCQSLSLLSSRNSSLLWPTQEFDPGTFVDAFNYVHPSLILEGNLEFCGFQNYAVWHPDVCDWSATSTDYTSFLSKLPSLCNAS